MANIGSALARGLLKGVGMAGEKIVDDRRQVAKEKRQEESAWKMFTKQNDYLAEKAKIVRDEQRAYEKEVLADERTYQEGQSEIQFNRQLKMENLAQSNRVALEGIRVAGQMKRDRQQIVLNAEQKAFDAEVEVGKNFTKLATMDIKELGALKAHRVAKNYPKDQYGQVFQAALEDQAGKNKAQLIQELDGVQPDYSRFANNPLYADAIPHMKTWTGIDMGEQFKFDPKEYEDYVNDTLENLTEGDKVRRDRENEITAKVNSGFAGAGVSEGVVSMMGPKAGTVFKDAAGNVIDSDMQKFAMLEAKGLVQQGPDGKWYTASEALVQRPMWEAEAAKLEAEAQAAAVGVGTVLSPDVAQPEAPEAPQAPQAERLIGEGGVLGQDVGEQQVRERAEIKRVRESASAGIKEMNKNQTLANSSALTKIEAALTDLPDEVFTVDMGAGLGSPEMVRNVQAKFGDEMALKVKDFAGEVNLLRNQIRNELFGATLTAGEKEAFDAAWEELGILTSRAGYANTLENIRSLNSDKVSAFLSGQDEDTQVEMAKRDPEIMRVYVDNIIEREGLDPARREEIIQFIKSQ